MMDLNYEPEHLRQAEQQLTQLFDKKEKTVLFVSVGEDMNTAHRALRRDERTAHCLAVAGID